VTIDGDWQAGQITGRAPASTDEAGIGLGCATGLQERALVRAGAEKAAGLNKAIEHQYIPLRRVARKKRTPAPSRQPFSSAALRSGRSSSRRATPAHGSPGAVFAAWFAPAARIVARRCVWRVHIAFGAIRFVFLVASVSHAAWLAAYQGDGRLPVPFCTGHVCNPEQRGTAAPRILSCVHRVGSAARNAVDSFRRGGR